MGMGRRDAVRAVNESEDSQNRSVLNRSSFFLSFLFFFQFFVSEKMAFRRFTKEKGTSLYTK